MPLAKALRLGAALRTALTLQGGPRIGPSRIWVVGSVRRRAAGPPGSAPQSNRAALAQARQNSLGFSTKDLDMLIVLPDSCRPNSSGPSPGRDLSTLAVKAGQRHSVSIRHSYAAGPRRRSCIVAHGGKNYRLDVFLAYDAELPYALLHHTGSHHYNIRVRAHAKRAGWKLNQYGVFEAAAPHRRAPGSARIKTEADLARFLGVSVRPPSAREW